MKRKLLKAYLDSSQLNMLMFVYAQRLRESNF